jgi:hypothetical protein
MMILPSRGFWAAAQNPLGPPLAVYGFLFLNAGGLALPLEKFLRLVGSQGEGLPSPEKLN